MSIKHRVAALRARGMSSSDVAEELGISPGTITQLEADDSYNAIYSQLTKASRIQKQPVYQQTDNYYDYLENQFAALLVANEDIILTAMASKPEFIMGFMTKLNGLTRRSAGEQPTAPSGTELVALELPTFITDVAPVAVQHNNANEVIEVGSTPLVSMSSGGLRRMSEASTEQKQLQKLKGVKVLDAMIPETSADLDL